MKENNKIGYGCAIDEANTRASYRMIRERQIEKMEG